MTACERSNGVDFSEHRLLLTYPLNVPWFTLKYSLLITSILPTARKRFLCERDFALSSHDWSM